MKILFYCPLSFNLDHKNNNLLGGIETLNLELSKEIAKKKHKVYLATLINKTFIRDKVINIPIKKILKNHKKLNFDIIISSNDPSIFNKYKNTKKIFWMHNTLALEKSVRKKKFLSLLTNKITTIFVSKYLKNITSKLYLFNKRIVIPNFLPKHFTSNKIIKKRKPIFVWSVQRDKGLVETINTWINEIYPINRHAKFYIFGVKKRPKNLSYKMLLNKNIHFFGRVSKRKLKNIYQKSMAMICLGYDETFCLNALEANSCGLPLITFGKTALGEMVIDKKNGLIADNFNDLAKKIKYLIFLRSKQRLKFIKNSYLNSKKYDLKNIIYLWLKLLK